MYGEVISTTPDSTSSTCMKTEEELSERFPSAVGPGWFDIDLNINVVLLYIG